ncbi:MAG: hypothetical protein INR71_03810 [Terriglobus roseus]|nr:hypothetical protein [Terriglobus roseus]
MAWGRVPVVGNVRLVVLSERMVKHGAAPPPLAPGPGGDAGGERLVVRWKTCGRAGAADERVARLLRGGGGGRAQSADSDDAGFCGLFLFEFDGEGRIARHVIERAEEGGSWEKTPNFISVTDWLLGRAWGRREEEVPPGAVLGYARAEDAGGMKRMARHGRG